jgi:two-component system nitrogen regulation response regulator GlnG/two-component system response regulator HydG
MGSETTVTSRRTPYSREAPREASLLGFAVIWSSDEPDRVGEVLLVPAGPVFVFGRDLGEEGAPRVAMCQQRPGRNHTTAPTASARVSRKQLLLRAAGPALMVANTGRCPMRLDGRAVQQAEVRVGQVLELEDVLSLLCIERPGRLPAPPPGVGLPAHPFGGPDGSGVVGESPAVWQLRSQVAFVAARNAHVLVTGPSGTGKELVARGIHGLSSRSKRDLVSRNAATLPDSLIDAELFGNVRDYPNPGMADRPGLIGEADGSTLFLDEVGELSHDLQAHLLRVLDEGEYQRLGESRRRRADLRLIAATNRSAEELKPDVRARLRVHVAVPDLNERREDIPLLARHLLRRIADDDPGVAHRFFEGGATGHPRVDQDLMRTLVQHVYTTHIRELEGFLWRAMGSSRGDYLEALAESATTPSSPYAEEPWFGDDPAAIPPEVIQACLDRNEGVQDVVWRELGLTSRHVLARLVKRYNLVLKVRGT